MPEQETIGLRAVPLSYARDTKRLYSKGIDLNNPIDSIRDGYYPILENMRSYTDGVLQPRLGITQISSGVITNQTPVHSTRRLNNVLNSTWTRVVGTGTKLATGQTSFTTTQYNGSDVTFSGKPLAMVPWRPDQSPVSWMYVADSSAMYKVTYNGSAVSTHKVGVAPPTVGPTVELNTPGIIGQPVSGSIFTAGAVAGGLWTNDGVVAGAITNGNRVTGVTVTKILYDSGTSGWCSIVPSSMANLGPGALLNTLTALNTEYVMIWEVYRASSPGTSNTVATILYESGSTGTCVVVPSGSTPELKRNSVVRLNGGANYFRVTEVMTGPNNTVLAFRCNTGATTISAGQSFEIVSSFRAYTVTQLDTSTTIQSDTLKSTFTPGATVIGTVTYTPAAALDLTFSGSVAFQDLDYTHFSFKTADLSQIVQIRALYDVDDGTFNKNYYYRAITPSDLVTAAKATQTTLSTKAVQTQNRIISRGIDRLPNDSGDFSTIGDSSNFSDKVDLPDSPDHNVDSPRDQTGTGDSQWSEVRFRRGDCTRVGTDWSKGWQAVNKIRFEVSMQTGGAATLMEFSSWDLFGGASPDIGDIGAPYLYRYRYRCSTTGAVSNWSPASRSGLLSLRTANKVTGTVSSAPEVDLIDFQRWGGLITSWADCGTVLNGSGILTDNVDDDFTRATIPDSVDNINYQPWPTAQTPKTGTATTLSGTMVKDSGANFNTAWMAGTGIKVNGIYSTLRRVYSSSLLELEDCVGQGSNLAWEIPEPFVQTNLPCLWGPGDGWFFACGDTTNPGRLYFSNKNNPDSTLDVNYIEATAPSEPLQNGFTFNSRNYVFSSEKLYEIVEISSGQFLARETPAGRGLMYRWAFCVGPKVWFLAKDGIYETVGDIANSISFDQLRPLFPKEGNLGTAVNGFFPPNMITGNITLPGMVTNDVSVFFRMCYEDSAIHFFYPDTNTRMRCLNYCLGSLTYEATSQTGWYPDVFNPGGSNTGVVFGYAEEGDGIHSFLLGGAEATTAKLYTYGGSDDNGTAINWHFRQACWDAGDRRADKLFADFIVDADPGSGTINVAAGINNYGSTATLNLTTMTGASRTQKVFDINSGNGVEAKNLAIDLTGTGTAARLYFVEPSYTLRPENSFLRAIQYDDTGYQGEKFWQGIEIEADTQNVARVVRVEYDGGQLADTLTIQHNGRLLKPYSFRSAFVAHLARLIPTDSSQWKLFRWRWVYEPEPPLVTVWDTQQTAFGHVGFVHLKAIWITHTSTADLTVTVTRMDDNTSQSFTVPNSGGVRGLETYLILGPASFCKGRTFKFKITQADSIPFRLYQRNTAVLVKPWGSQQAYAKWMGWGGDSGDGFAQI
jgi:hypothetical protein